jgi:glycerol-3-phosphate acyltransferase PlsY
MGGAATQELCYVSGLLAVIGHVFPLWYKFKGGKGVLATATVFLMLCPAGFAAMFILFVAIVAASKYVSLGSVTVAVLYPVVVNAYVKLVFNSTPHFILSLCLIILAVFIVWCHRENLVRISNRTERKISIGGKKKKEENEEHK